MTRGMGEGGGRVFGAKRACAGGVSFRAGEEN